MWTHAVKQVSSGNRELGDFDTPEARIGDFDTINTWESNMTLNDSWGWIPKRPQQIFQ